MHKVLRLHMTMTSLCLQLYICTTPHLWNDFEVLRTLTSTKVVFIAEILSPKHSFEGRTCKSNGDTRAGIHSLFTLLRSQVCTVFHANRTILNPSKNLPKASPTAGNFRPAMRWHDDTGDTKTNGANTSPAPDFQTNKGNPSLRKHCVLVSCLEGEKLQTITVESWVPRSQVQVSVARTFH